MWTEKDSETSGKCIYLNPLITVSANDNEKKKNVLTHKEKHFFYSCINNILHNTFS